MWGLGQSTGKKAPASTLSSLLGRPMDRSSFWSTARWKAERACDLSGVLAYSTGRPVKCPPGRPSPRSGADQAASTYPPLLQAPGNCPGVTN